MEKKEGPVSRRGGTISRPSWQQLFHCQNRESRGLFASEKNDALLRKVVVYGEKWKKRGGLDHLRATNPGPRVAGTLAKMKKKKKSVCTFDQRTKIFIKNLYGKFKRTKRLLKDIINIYNMLKRIINDQRRIQYFLTIFTTD